MFGDRVLRHAKVVVSISKDDKIDESVGNEDIRGTGGTDGVRGKDEGTGGKSAGKDEKENENNSNKDDNINIDNIEGE